MEDSKKNIELASFRKDRFRIVILLLLASTLAFLASLPFTFLYVVLPLYERSHAREGYNTYDGYYTNEDVAFTFKYDPLEYDTLTTLDDIGSVTMGNFVPSATWTYYKLQVNGSWYYQLSEKAESINIDEYMGMVEEIEDCDTEDTHHTTNCGYAYQFELQNGRKVEFYTQGGNLVRKDLALILSSIKWKE